MNSLFELSKYCTYSHSEETYLNVVISVMGMDPFSWEGILFLCVNVFTNVYLFYRVYYCKTCHYFFVREESKSSKLQT